MDNQTKDTIVEALKKSVPIISSYLLVSMAYGMMMQEAGLSWFWALFTSLTVYTGAFQFVLITFISSGASLLTIGMTALFMNSRQFFYGLTFVEDFKSMGRRYPYMVNTMTDETYAVNYAMLVDQKVKNDKERHNMMFLVAIFSKTSWLVGAVLGSVLGQLLPFTLEGIDFCMTALFVTIFIDQWKAFQTHIPAIIGLAIGILLLLILGPDYFLLPALLLVSGILVALQGQLEAGRSMYE